MPIPSRLLLALLILPSLVATPSKAAPILLEDGVAFLEVDPNSQDGLTAWTVNGVQHMRTQWFWLGGVGEPEVSLDHIRSGATASDANGDGDDETLEIVFFGVSNVYRAHLDYALIGSAPSATDASAFSQLTIELRISATQDLDLRLFQYSDVDLFGSFADDEALFAGATATVTDSSGLGSYESVWDVPPTGFDAALYDATLASLNDGAPSALGNSTSASGDVTLAGMWEISIAAGDSFTLRQTQTIRVVPEPGVALLLALGLAGLAARRQGVAR